MLWILSARILIGSRPCIVISKYTLPFALRFASQPLGSGGPSKDTGTFSFSGLGFRGIVRVVIDKIKSSVRSTALFTSGRQKKLLICAGIYLVGGARIVAVDFHGRDWHG